MFCPVNDLPAWLVCIVFGDLTAGGWSLVKGPSQLDRHLSGLCRPCLFFTRKAGLSRGPAETPHPFQGSAHGKVDLLLSRWPYSMTSYLLSSCLWHFFWLKNPVFSVIYDPVVNRITQPRIFQPLFTVGWSTGVTQIFAAKKVMEAFQNCGI